MKKASGVKTGGLFFLLRFAVFMFDNCHLDVDALKIITPVIFGLDPEICCSRCSGQGGVWHGCESGAYFFCTESVCCDIISY